MIGLCVVISLIVYRIPCSNNTRMTLTPSLTRVLCVLQLAARIKNAVTVDDHEPPF